MIAIDARQPTETPTRSPFDQCDVAPRAFSCSHFFDSGTNSRMKNTSSAGSAPLIIRKRHPEFASRRLDHRRRHADAEQQRLDAADEAVQADAQHADHQKSEIRGRADEPGNQRARFVRPDFVDQRHAERPLAAHAERGDEPQRRDVPRFGREAAQSGEHRIREDAQRHRAHAADAIAEPAEEHAAGRGADEEHGDDGAEPLRGLRGRRGSKQIVERRPADQRKQAHLEAVEHPSQQGGRQRHPASEVRFGGLRHIGGFDRLRGSVEQGWALHVLIGAASIE